MNCEGFLACKNGDLDAIQNLDQRVLRGVTFERDTVLHIAAREGHFHVVEWILNNVEGMCDALNYDFNTPLHEAAKGGNDKVVEILLGHNKKSASRLNLYRETPLLIACEYGHMEAATLLVEATPRYLIFRGSNNRHTCLQAAAYEGLLEVVRSMLDKRWEFWNMYQPYSIISWWRQLLATRSMVRFPHDTQLHRAVHGGHVSIVREILDRAVLGRREILYCREYMTETDQFGRCAVHVAAVQGRLDIIQEFISSFPCCVTIRAENYKTPLHFAVESNRYQVVLLLLSTLNSEKKAILVSCDRDNSGNTALHLAAIEGVDSQLMQYLVSIPGVKVNAVNNEGLTALDIAAAQNQKPNSASIVKILQDAGAIESYITLSNSNCEDFKECKRGRADYRQKRDVHTLVASLIATITFAAVFQIPGGIESDPNHEQYGVAKLGLRKLFRVFLVSDSLAFCASLTVVIEGVVIEWVVIERGTHIYRPDIQIWLVVSIICTCITFITATILVVLPHKYYNAADRSFVKNNYAIYDNLIFCLGTIQIPPMLSTVSFILIPLLLRGTKYFVHSASRRLIRQIDRMDIFKMMGPYGVAVFGLLVYVVVRGILVN